MRMRASAVLALVVGVVLGFMAGGFAPRRELSALRKEHAELKDQLAALEQPDLLGGLLPRLAAGAMSRPAGPGAPSQVASSSAAQTSPEPAGRKAIEPSQIEGGLSELEAFESVQTARAAASRQSLLERADLSDAQQERLDTALADVQQQLLDMSGRAALQLIQLPEPDPKDMLALAHDVSGVLLTGQEALDGVIADSGTRPGALDEKTRQVWNHLNLEGVSDRMRAALQQLSTTRPPTAGLPAGE